MQGKTHLAAGVAVGLSVASTYSMDLPRAALATGLAAVAALAPDWLQINIPGLNRTIKGAFGHRGFSHWLLTAWLVYLAVGSVACQHFTPDHPLSLAVLAGWTSHIILDSFTDPGVPALWPLPWRLHLAGFDTGGGTDGLFCWVFIALSTWKVLSLVM